MINSRSARYSKSYLWTYVLFIEIIGLFLNNSSTVLAEELPSVELEPIVVTGTRISSGADTAASNITIIDRDQIEARHPSSAVELFRTLPGVVIQQAGGRGSVASIFTRGAKPNFTVVLIDGVKVNDPINTRGGSFDFSTLSVDAIDRVEVVRGPESAIYGSDAVGGVINIITRAGSSELALDSEASGGRFGYSRAAAQIGGPIDAVATRLGISYTDNGSPVEGSMFRGATVNGALTGKLYDSAAFEIKGRYGVNHAESFPDASGGPLLAVIRDVDRRNIDEAVVGAHVDHQIAPQWTQGLQLGLYDRVSSATSPGVAPSSQDPGGIPRNTDDTNFRRLGTTWTHNFVPDSRLKAAVGIDFQLEQGGDRGSLQFGKIVLPTEFSLQRRIWAGFAETRYRVFPGLELSASARYDVPTHATAHFSPKLAAAYTVAPTDTTLQLSWGRGFKLPSFFALGNPIVGDPTLKPETSTTVEAGISQELAAVPGRLKLAWFRTAYGNLIDFNPGPVPKLVNLPTVQTHGGEMSLQLRLGENLSLEPYISYTLTRNETTGTSLRDVPRWLAGGNLLWHPGETITVNLTVSNVGSYTDNSVPTGDVRLAGIAGSTWARRGRRDRR